VIKGMGRHHKNLTPFPSPFPCLGKSSHPHPVGYPLRLKKKSKEEIQVKKDSESEGRGRNGVREKVDGVGKLEIEKRKTDSARDVLQCLPLPFTHPPVLPPLLGNHPCFLRRSQWWRRSIGDFLPSHPYSFRSPCPRWEKKNNLGHYHQVQPKLLRRSEEKQ
jgi:hypothetical protein